MVSKTLLIALICVSGASRGVAAKAARTPRIDKAALIREANALIAATEHDRTMRVDSSTNVRQWLGYQTEYGGTLWAYYAGDSLRKITADMYHGLGMVRIEIYYQRNAPVFFYEREDYYPKVDTSLDRTKLEYGHDARYYVHDGKLLEGKRRGKDRYGKIISNAETVRKLMLMSDRWSTFFKH